MASTTRQALFTGAQRRRGRIYFRPAAGAAAGCQPRCRAQGGSGAYRAGLCAGSRLPPGATACWAATLLHRGGRPLPRPGAAVRHAGKHQPHRKLLALEGAVHGTLVLAGGQTAGRGRLGAALPARRARGCTARWCCARRCLPPTPRPPPSAQQWQCAGRCRRCAGWNLPSSG